jgi:hypothetical protein
MYEIQKTEVEFIFVPDDFYHTFKDVIKTWYENFEYCFPTRIPEAQIFSMDYQIGFEFESGLIWFAGAILEIAEPDNEFASMHDLSVMEQMWFEEDMRTLLDAESITYMYDGELKNSVILEVW